MVSTRPKSRHYFEKGEKVLCYEPDLRKAKVLYDSKILGIYEAKDKRGRKVLQYKVHFQGWSSSWDRKVNADFILKDTQENRQLQRDLAEKEQLHLGAYLYRKDRCGNNKKRSRKSLTIPEEGGVVGITTGISGTGSAVTTTATTTAITATTTSVDNIASSRIRARLSSEDNYSSGSTFEKHEDFPMRDECETESCCSSIESFHDEERVMLRISERLRQYLEYDHDMIVKYKKQHSLPARISVVAILENFVKQSAIQFVLSKRTQAEGTRRRSAQLRAEKKEREFEKLVANVALLKEVADGLRIYFDFTIKDYLLYKEEKEYAFSYLSEENLKNFTYVAVPGLTPDFLLPKCDLEQSVTLLANTEATENLNIDTTASTSPTISITTNITTTAADEPQKRKLRSHRSEDTDVLLDNCLSSIASTGSSGASTPSHSMNATHSQFFKTLPAMSLSIPTQTRDFMQGVLSWCLLPADATPAPSMIFGAPHLARLIVKLPEFLNASSMNDEKLKVLLQHLDTFINYLEAREEWFNEDNYARSSATTTLGKINIPTSSTTTATVNADDNPRSEMDIDVSANSVATDVTETTTNTGATTITT